MESRDTEVCEGLHVNRVEDRQEIKKELLAGRTAQFDGLILVNIFLQSSI